VGESPSARTERELGRLRESIDRDLDALAERVREDVDPRQLFQRQPVAVIGSVASLAAAAVVGLVPKLRARSRRRPDREIDRVIEGLGGRVERRKGRARKRFREQLREEIGKVERPKRRVQEAAFGALAAGLTALATTVARGFGRRLLADERMKTRERDEAPRT
jgi:hypothetical protein